MPWCPIGKQRKFADHDSNSTKVIQLQTDEQKLTFKSEEKIFVPRKISNSFDWYYMVFLSDCTCMLRQL